MDLTGNILHQQTLLENKGKIMLNTNLPVGIYLLTIRDENNQLLYITKVGLIE